MEKIAEDLQLIMTRIENLEKSNQEILNKLNASQTKSFPHLDAQLCQKEEKELKIYRSQHSFENDFSVLALDYLTKRNPDNVYINVFDEITQRFFYDFGFILSGLIYDETDNILHMVKTIYNVEVSKLLEIEENVCKFRDFVVMERPNGDSDKIRKMQRRWDFFFGKDGIVQAPQRPTVSVFLGFENCGFDNYEYENLLHRAREMGFPLRGPDGSYNKVLG